MKLKIPARADRTPWFSAILSLLPFVIAGPVRIMVNFQPGWRPEEQSLNYLLFLLISSLLVAGGLVLGAIKKFPRWSYPYVVYLSFSLYILMLTTANIFHWNFKITNSFLLILAVLLIILWLPGLRSFYRNTREDWTLLTYALFGLVMFLMSSIDKDETPRLTLMVLLPSVLTLIAALAHLRIRSTIFRIAVLLIGMFAALFIWLTPIFVGMETVLAGIGMGLFVLLAYSISLTAILLAPLLVMSAVQFWRGTMKVNLNHPE